MSRAFLRMVPAGVVALALVACGSKTGLFAPDAQVDASPMDAGRLDAFVPPDVFVPPVDAYVPPDVCIEVPPREPPRSVEVSFVSRILSAEVYFLVDVTGSMDGEIRQIRDHLRDTIIPGIAAQIPDVRFSVGRFADFPVEPYGSDGRSGSPADDVYRLEQRSTGDLDAVQRGIDRLALQSGGDIPESAVEALYVSATADAPSRLVPPRSCPTGTVGYPCFQREGSRIFLLFTDAPMHNGPGGAEPYGPRLGFRSHTYDETVIALRAIGAKVLGLYSGDSFDGGLDHLQRVARDTGAVRPDGTPIVFDIGTDGASLGPDVVEAVRTLVEEVPIDVDALTEDWPTDEVDATEYVAGIVAVAAEPPSGATRLPDRFVGVRPGTRVRFSVLLENERFERLDYPQVHRLVVVLRGDGVTRLSETIVDIVVPAIDGDGCDELGL